MLALVDPVAEHCRLNLQRLVCSIGSPTRASSDFGTVIPSALVNDELELYGALDRYLRGFRPAQNPIYILAGVPELVVQICAIRHCASHVDVLPSAVRLEAAWRPRY